MPQLLLLLKRGVPLLSAAVVTTAAACNSISGVNELDFRDVAGVSTGSGGGAASAGTGASDAGASGGAGGTGGVGCGPCEGAPACHEWTGCDAGVCVYTPVRAGEPCADADACTEGDACDERGQCQPGPVCPAAECQVRTCDAGVCTAAVAVGDGALCGAMNPGDRCCGGTCRDLSTDPDNCGGCGLVCATGDCQSVAVTSDCDMAPAMTSGRCTCPLGASSQCPFDGDTDLCRDMQENYNKLCAPKSNAGCAPGQTFVALTDCPNYCIYP